MPKKKETNPMGIYNPTEEEVIARDWCINNNIKISPGGINGKQEWTVDIDLGKGYRKSPKSYKKVEVWEVYYNYCKYYYEKKNR